jgi:hypothetical protein
MAFPVVALFQSCCDSSVGEDLPRSRDGERRGEVGRAEAGAAARCKRWNALISKRMNFSMLNPLKCQRRATGRKLVAVFPELFEAARGGQEKMRLNMLSGREGRPSRYRWEGE